MNNKEYNLKEEQKNLEVANRPTWQKPELVVISMDQTKSGTVPPVNTMEGSFYSPLPS